MKKIFLAILCLLIVNVLFSQAPQRFTYQAALRGSDGQVLANKSVKLRLSFLSGGETGASLYTEEHSVTTSSLGLINIEAGGGTLVSGSFSGISWSAGNIWLKVEVDESLTGSFANMGSTKLLSVPYALFAESGNGQLISGTMGQTLRNNGGSIWVANDNLYNNGTNVGIGTNAPLYKLDINGDTRLQGNLFDKANSFGSTSKVLTGGASGVFWKDLPTLGITSGTGLAGELALWSGNNSIQGLSNLSWGTSLQINSVTTSDPDAPILEVKNSDGQVVFGVYQGGVRINVQDAAMPHTKGVRAGFAVGGLTNQAKGQAEYFRITPDSARVYVKEFPVEKGVRGGFAVGGLTNQAKTITSRNMLFVAPDSTRIYVNDPSKGVRGGFAVGGLTNQGKGGGGNFMQLTPDNYFIGHNSGVRTTGLYNSFIGYESGSKNIIGSNNVFLGYRSGYNNDASNNTFIGYQSGLGNSTGQFNSFMGYNTGQANTVGSYNCFWGTETGYLNTEGSSNIFIGNKAGYTNTIGGNNIFLGYKAGYNNTGNYNIMMGNESGYSNTEGEYNVFLGFQSGSNNSTGEYNTFLGFKAGYASNANYNSFIGYQAGKANTSGQYNSFMGYNAGLGNTTGASNVFIGHQSGAINTSGERNVFIGTAAGYNNNGSYNIAMGDSAGYALTSGAYNVAIGEMAGHMLTSGLANVFIGPSAGFHQTTEAYNVMIGPLAGYNAIGSYNTFIGINASFKIKSSVNNVFLGTNAGAMLEEGRGNTIIGIDAGRGGDWDPYDYHSGYVTSNNTIIGNNAGYNINIGNDNIMLGSGAGFSISSGSGNVLIGKYAGPSNDQDNKLYIANAAGTPLIFGDFSSKLIGFGTIFPLSNVHIEASGVNQFGHLLINRNNPAGLGGELVLRNNGGNAVGNAAAIGFELDASTAFETDGSRASNAEIRSTIDGANGSTKVQISNLGPSGTYNNGILLAGSGYVGLGTTAPISNLHVNSTTINQYGNLLVNRAATGALGGTLVLRNATSNFLGNAAALSFELDGSTAFETNGATAGNAEIRSTIVGANGASNLQISNWNGSSINTGIVLASSGNVGIGKANPSTALDVSGDAAVSGNIYGNLTGGVNGNVLGDLTGNVTGSVNGVTMGFIRMTDGGDVITIGDESYTLYWDKTNGKFQITNYGSDWCDLWYRAQKGATAEGGTNSIASGSVKADIITGTNTDLSGFEIHFGQADGNDGWCSVWLQYCHGVLVGHYIKN